MTKGAEESPEYDLEERTFHFAHRVRAFIKRLPRTICNAADARQLVRSSGSIGANYIEANEGLSHKDFVLRARIARRECKETRYWLRLVDIGAEPGLTEERQILVNESTEIKKILSALIRKTT